MNKKKKRRLMILIWDMGIGGVQKRIKDVLFDIDQNYPGWEVFLCIKLKRPGYFTEEISKKTKVNIHFSPFANKDENSAKSLRALYWIIREYLTINPDVCLTFLDYLSIIMVFTTTLFFWKRTKLVLNEGIFTSEYLKIYRKKVKLWEFLVRNTYRYANHIIVPTRAIKKDLNQNFSVSKEMISVIPNWTLLKHQTPQKRKYDLIFIGRLEEEKNPLALLAIVKKIKKNKPDVTLAVIGTGSLINRIRRKIDKEELAENIKLLGFKREVSNYLRPSGVLILPTLNEGLPNVILEAAMSRVPVVTTAFPGVKEVVKHSETGFVCKTQKEMATYALRLINNENLRKNLGKNAMYLADKNFSYKNQKRYISTLLN